MDRYAENAIRNIVILAHSGTGKTTFSDSLLYASGLVSRQGNVDEGTSNSDYDPIEIAHKVSINTSLLYCISGKNKINIIDTPGYADFIVELRNAVPAAETGVVLISAHDGIQVGTQRVWNILENKNMPRVIFINKIDKENSDFFKAVEDIQAGFGNKCVPVFMPLGKEAGFKAVVNLFSKNGWAGLSEEEKGKAEKFREALIELIAEANDDLIEKYLNGEELTQDEINAAFKKSLRENKITPIFCGNPVNQLGIKEFIKIVAEFFPGPADWEEIDALDPQTKEKKMVKTKADKLFSAFVFKTI